MVFQQSHTGTATTTIVVPARRTAHLEKIQVTHNNHGQDENCLRALLYVCMGGADTQEVLHMENHHQGTEAAGCYTPG